MERVRAEATRWPGRGDEADDLTPEVDRLHPFHTKRYDLHNRAMDLVGNRRSKGALVSLVAYLLLRGEQVRAEALEEAAEALPRILKIFGAGCSVAGPARVGGSGHDDPNPAGCPDCVEAAVAAIRALKGGKHG